jgi:hypothetical protein
MTRISKDSKCNDFIIDSSIALIDGSTCPATTTRSEQSKAITIIPMVGGIFIKRWLM